VADVLCQGTFELGRADPHIREYDKESSFAAGPQTSVGKTRQGPLEREARKAVDDDGEIGFLIELAGKCNDLHDAREDRWDDLLAIIANDWGRCAGDSLRKRKD
jgi:hypothetical protein